MLNNKVILVTGGTGSFGQKFAEMVGAKYAVAVTSASHGQDLVMKAKGLKGIDVINPTMSFIATATIPLWNDCTTNIVDIREDDLNIDPDDVSEAGDADKQKASRFNKRGKQSKNLKAQIGG